MFLQELLAKPTEIETLSTRGPIGNDPSHPHRDKLEHRPIGHNG
jgi:hypothetical protein